MAGRIFLKQREKTSEAMENEIGSRRPYTFDRVTRLVITAVCVAVGVWLFNYLRGVLIPFFAACIIAYMLNPLVEWNGKLLRLKGRVWPVILTIVEVTAVIGVGLRFFIPYLYTECENMIAMFQTYAKANFDVPYLPKAIHDFIVETVNVDKLSSLLTREEWINLFKEAASSTWSFVGGTLSVILSIVSWFIVLLYIVFILIDYDKVMNGFKSVVPPRHKKRIFGILDDVKVSMNRYFRGQALVSFFVGISFCIGFWIIDLPMAVVLGMCIGVLNMVPYLQLISIPVAAGLCLVSTVSTGTDFWEMFWLVILVYCVSQVIQDLILIPKIMGKYMGLNPAIIFLSLSIWGALLGFIGLVIAVPLTTLLLAYYEKYIIRRNSRPWNAAQDSVQAVPPADEEKSSDDVAQP